MDSGWAGASVAQPNCIWQMAWGRSGLASTSEIASQSGVCPAPGLAAAPRCATPPFGRFRNIVGALDRPEMKARHLTAVSQD